MSYHWHRFATVLACALCMTACASGPDRFYHLDPAQAAITGTRQHFSAEVSIRVSIPSVIDRNQLVLERPDGVQVLEHERWASPLTDQITSVLGQDLEQLRPEILVNSNSQPRASGLPRFTVHIDVVTLTLRRAGAVQMEARWRVEASGGSLAGAGRDVYTATAAGTSTTALAAAASQCVAQLADRVAQVLEAHDQSRVSPDS